MRAKFGTDENGTIELKTGNPKAVQYTLFKHDNHKLSVTSDARGAVIYCLDCKADVLSFDIEEHSKPSIFRRLFHLRFA